MRRTEVTINYGGKYMEEKKLSFDAYLNDEQAEEMEKFLTRENFWYYISKFKIVK